METRVRWRAAALLIPLLLTGAQAQTRSPLAALIERLSEAPGYFDSDNLVSNETSYLHVLGALRREGLKGGVYLGVGPEQGYSYIAELEPALALMVDVRRDNLLLHLLFKAMFEEADTRVEYLALLYGRPAPEAPARFATLPLDAVLLHIDAVRSDPGHHARNHERLMRRVAGYGVPLSDEDRSTLRRFHDEFAEMGLGLRYRSRGRPMRMSYPSARDLYLATDLEGGQGSYLATEERWRRVQALHRADRIVPVVGDLAGPRAIRAIAEYLRELNLTVSLYYLSNVEFYLFRSETFGAFVENVRALPAGPGSMLVRSVFNRGYMHPGWVPGHLSVQLMQRWPDFLAYTQDPWRVSYWGLTAEAPHVDLRGGSPTGP